MPIGSRASSAAAAIAPDAGRAEHVAVAAQARRLLRSRRLHGAGSGRRPSGGPPGARRQKPRWFVPSRNVVPLAASGEA